MRTLALLLCLGMSCLAQAQFVEIPGDVVNDFGSYAPHHVDTRSNLPVVAASPGLVNVTNAHAFRLDAAIQAALETKGFVATPSHFEQMYGLYQSLRDCNIPLFVTTDAVLHAYHILYDYTLRMLEVDAFVQDLEQLTLDLLREAEAHYATASSPLAGEAAHRNVAFFLVAAELLELRPTLQVPSARELAASELNLILPHQGMAPSPIFGYPEDYTQYIPRGHYTRNETLERFFRAMMWYGRMGFRLKTDDEADRIETAQALLITVAVERLGLLPQWDRIYEPTVFFVGKADDLTLRDYQGVAAQVYGPDFASQLPDVLMDRIDDFMELARQLPPPRISSSVISDAEDFREATLGFRFMGQRFIPDSYILFQLTHKRVPGRFLPRGLDVMAVFGSQRAYRILSDLYGERSYPNYQDQLAMLQAEFASLTPADWAQNLYWNWLYALMPLLDPTPAGHPNFMRHPAWADKELATALGSWTELRHDTILYAKQGYSELTSIPPEPQRTRGYVEPNPEVYGRLASLTQMMRSGLTARGLAMPVFDERLAALERLLIALKEISEAELAGTPLTEDQYQVIWEIGDTLEYLNSFPPDVAQLLEGEEDGNMAVVADVHTDPNSAQVLEEGVGHPLLLHVLVPDGDQLKLVQGGMFSYYEFPHPMSDRLTDAKWQEMVRQQAVALPVWMGSFVAESAFEPQSQSEAPPRWDINGDGTVDVLDMVQVAMRFGRSTQVRHAWLDMNDDGELDIRDLVVIGQHFGERTLLAAPTVASTPVPGTVWLARQDTPDETLVTLHVREGLAVQGIQFDGSFDSQAVLTAVSFREGVYQMPPTIGNGRLAAFAALTVDGQPMNHDGIAATLRFARVNEDLDLQLQDFLLVTNGVGVLKVPTVALRTPDEPALDFRLMPNYPNPFNPETWIPYELPQPLRVTLSIYAATGEPVRFMELGTQPAGRYVSRERAIHWDGRNNAGEAVASGSYVVELKAGSHSARRTLLVVK